MPYYARAPYYAGRIIIGPKLRRWMHRPEHRRFATEDWVRGQLRWGTWRMKRRRSHYYVIVTDVEGYKKVKIQFIHYPNGNPDYPFDHVYSDHAHLIG